jgi:Tol biopolymer transport system component
MDADGTDVQQLTDNDRYDEDPAWSPDGNRIVFASDRNGFHGIFVMDTDGINVVTTNQRGMYPAWR